MNERQIYSMTGVCSQHSQSRIMCSKEDCIVIETAGVV